MPTLWSMLFLTVINANDVTTLQKGQALEKNLPKGAAHHYKLNLPAHHSWVAVVHQLGADVVVDVANNAGEQVDSIDAPTGASGPEWVTMSSGEGGSWLITVRHYDEAAPAGNYSIEWLSVTPEASGPGGKVAQIMAIYNDPGSPGAAIAVRHRGKLVYSKGFGSANLEYGIPVDVDTPFHVASVSKQITAFAVAMLDSQGKLSLTDHVRQHLPEVPDFGTPITLRQLIDHTSGLRDQWDLLTLAGWVYDDVITQNDIMSLVKRQRDLNFPPGSEMIYCNTGYTLLAEVVGRVTGQSFKDWTDDTIFRPLGMKSSHFHDDHRHLVPNRAYSYNHHGRVFRKSVLNYANVGATSLFTTAEDLLLWSKNFETKNLGNQALYEQLHQSAKLNDGSSTGYAFGQFLSTYRGLSMIQHSGADAGFRAFLARFPKQEFSIAVCGNLGSMNVMDIAHKITNIYLADAIEAQAKPQPTEQETQPKRIEMGEEALSAYAGDYALKGQLIRLRVTGQGLEGRYRGRPLRLEPLGEERFRSNIQKGLIAFVRDEHGKVTGFRGNQNTAKRVLPFHPDNKALKAYSGRFYSREVAIEISVEVNGDNLTVHHPRHGQVVLRPGLEDQFLASSFWLNELNFIQTEDSRVKELLLSTGRSRNLRFERRD